MWVAFLTGVSFRHALRSTRPSNKWVPGAYRREKSGLGINVTNVWSYIFTPQYIFTALCSIDYKQLHLSAFNIRSVKKEREREKQEKEIGVVERGQETVSPV
jgi:hypothetical protein